MIFEMNRIYILLFLLYSNKVAALSCKTDNFDSVKNIIENDMEPPITLVYYQNSSANEWFFRMETTKFLLNPSGNPYIKHTFHKFQKNNYVFFIDNLIELSESLSYLNKLQELNSDGKFFIIYQMLVSYEQIKESFHILWTYNIYRSIIHTINKKLFVWFPYDTNSECGRIFHPVKTLREGPFDNRIPKNLNGCQVTISWNMHAIFMWNPFNDTYPGALFIAINTIGEIMNFTPQYLSNNSDFLVDFLKTGTFETAKQDVQDRNIDLILYGSDNGQHVHLTYLQDLVKDVTFYSLKPSDPTVQINCYFNMFLKTILTATILVSLVTAVLLKLLTNQTYSDSVFDVYRLMFQLNIPKAARYLPARPLLTSFILFIYFVDIKYNSLLSSVFTLPGTVNRLDTTDQFEGGTAANIKHSSIRRFLYFTGLNDSLGRTSNNLWVIIPKTISNEQVIEDFISSHSHAAYVHIHELKQYSRKDVEKLQISSEERMTGIEYKVAARKGFPLTNTLNYWIEALLQSGLMEKWIYDQAILLRKFIIESPGPLDKTKFGFHQLRGAFYILIGGYLISLVAFLFELFLFKKGFFGFYLP